MQVKNAGHNLDILLTLRCPSTSKFRVLGFPDTRSEINHKFNENLSIERVLTEKFWPLAPFSLI